MLNDAHGKKLAITPGMQIVAEIKHGKRSMLEYLLSPVRKTVQEATQGKRTVLKYLLSPVRKTVQEAGRER